MRRAARLTFLLWYVADDPLYKQSCVWKNLMKAVVSISVSFVPQLNMAMTEMLRVNCTRNTHQASSDLRFTPGNLVAFNKVAFDLD